MNKTFDDIIYDAIARGAAPDYDYPKITDAYRAILDQMSYKFSLPSRFDHTPDPDQVYKDAIRFLSGVAHVFERAANWVVEQYLFAFKKKSNKTILDHMAMTSIKETCSARNTDEHLQTFLINYLLDYGKADNLPTDRFAKLYDVIEDLDVRLTHDYNTWVGMYDNTP